MQDGEESTGACEPELCTHRLRRVHWKGREVVGISEKVFSLERLMAGSLTFAREICI